MIKVFVLPHFINLYIFIYTNVSNINKFTTDFFLEKSKIWEKKNTPPLHQKEACKMKLVTKEFKKVK